ncbi:MAG: hypothetical protein WCA56_06035 [Xanthobacteraceae bacterium]
MTLIAIIIVACVGAVFAGVAGFLTARSRIGLAPAAAQNANRDGKPVAGDLPESARHFRVFGWVLVVLLYLVTVFCLLQGLNDLRIVHHWAQWQAVFGGEMSDPAEIALYVRFWFATAIVLAVIGFWTQRRLRRHAK